METVNGWREVHQAKSREAWAHDATHAHMAWYGTPPELQVHVLILLPGTTPQEGLTRTVFPLASRIFSSAHQAHAAMRSLVKDPLFIVNVYHRAGRAAELSAQSFHEQACQLREDARDLLKKASQLEKEVYRERGLS